MDDSFSTPIWDSALEVSFSNPWLYSLALYLAFAFGGLAIVCALIVLIANPKKPLFVYGFKCFSVATIVALLGHSFISDYNGNLDMAGVKFAEELNAKDVYLTQAVANGYESVDKAYVGVRDRVCGKGERVSVVYVERPRKHHVGALVGTVDPDRDDVCQVQVLLPSFVIKDSDILITA